MKRITPGEQNILNAARDVLADGHHASISEVAHAAGCAISSVHYLAKKLGYNGWSQMSHELRHGQTHITRFEHEADIQLIEICKLLQAYKDKPLLIDAIGDGEVASSYLFYKLTCRGFIPVPFLMSALQSYCTNKRQGIVFVINESGIVLADDCKMAKKAGFSLISFTRALTSPVALASDFPIDIKDNKSSYRTDYEPNFFAAKVIAFIEILFAQYDRLILTS